MFPWAPMWLSTDLIAFVTIIIAAVWLQLFFAMFIIVKFLQLNEDTDSILHALREETNLGEERQIIWLLWHQRLHLLRQQTQFEVITSSLNLPAADNTDLPNKLLVSKVCTFMFKSFLEFCFVKYL